MSRPPETPERILADLRHDLRTPIGHILGFAEILIEDTAEAGSTMAEDLEHIRTAGQRLLRLIDERLRPEIFSIVPETTGTVVTPGTTTVASIIRTLPQPQDSDHGRVLIVDDVEENRNILARRLQRSGHDTTLAADGQEALDLLSQQAFDLIFLDIMMPGMDGYEVLQRIKSDTSTAYIPVVMVSALDETQSVARCIEMGAEDYLTKPVDPILLKARLKACLRAKRAHDRETQLTAQLQQNLTKLQVSERMRDDLTGMIVHDLRTPLTSILTGLQTMNMIGGLSADHQELLGISVDGAQTLLGMINDLLDISKIEDGSLRLEYTPLNPQKLVGDALKQVMLLGKNRGLSLVSDVASDVPVFPGDEDKLRRILVNLLGNAIKFTPSGGTVTLHVARLSDGNLRFAVEDTGEGIPGDAFSRIFEKFGQVEDRKAGRKMSTGLGLTFCKMAVEAHGGHIWVESELGIGSRFLFTIPGPPV